MISSAGEKVKVKRCPNTDLDAIIDEMIDTRSQPYFDSRLSTE
jgi:hypothetical protein